LLIWSQVILSMQLSFAVIPLLLFTDNRAKMGRFANPLWIKSLAWISAAVIVILNAKLLFDFFAPQSWQDALGI
jgi:manganese transport protein